MSMQYMGEVRIMAFNYAPKYWAQCAGQTVVHQSEPGAVLAAGHDLRRQRRHHLRLPDLRTLVPGHAGAGYVLGQVHGRVQPTPCCRPKSRSTCTS
jgi:microcystin-dependent protein